MWQHYSREETTKLIELIRESSDAILHGTAGNGKSVVLYELTQNFRLENIPFLPIRLDRREPKNTAAQFGGDMGLPDSPVYSLIALAGERLVFYCWTNLMPYDGHLPTPQMLLMSVKKCSGR
jgi:hypothetical protein